MICNNCHRDIAEPSIFCPFCGKPQQGAAGGPTWGARRLMRSATDRKIAGVCGGIAEFFGVDSTVVRLIWVLLVILPVPLVPAFVGYLVAWLVMPQAPFPAAHTAQQPPVNIPNPTQAA